MRNTSLQCAAVLLFFTAIYAPAQSHLAVDIKDPVYRLIEIGELKGAVSRLSAVRPYSHSNVVRLLEQMWDHRTLFTPAERQVLEETRRRFTESHEGPKYGNLTFRQGDRTLQTGVDFAGEGRVNVQEGEDWHMDTVTRIYMRGDLAPWLSYMGTMGPTFDRVREQEAFVPYEFTKEWDSFHIWFSSPRYSTGELDYPTPSYHLGTDITAQFYDGDVVLRLARLRREWGFGDGSLTLGGTARPFLGLEGAVRFAPWLNLSHVTGTLNNWYLEPEAGYSGDTRYTYQKLFTLQRLEMFPLPWLYLSASSSVIGAKRFEPGYMAPLLFSLIYQNLISEDLDNVGVGVDLGVTIAPFGRAYFSFYADEMEPASLKELRTRPRNMFAYQAGIKVPIPGLPFTALTFQYTKIEPFVYAHFPSWYPDYRLQVETSYTNDGENLGYHIPPNSDEFLVRFWAMPLSSLSAGLTYQLIRHGDNPSAIPGDPAILGRTDGWYTAGANAVEKDFLHDGLYDWNNILTLGAEYTLPWAPVTVGLSYSFSYTFWVVNASGEPPRPDQIKNILALSVRVFR